MRKTTPHILFLVFLLFLCACKKEFPNTKQNAFLYSSNGNFLLLVIENKLVEAYEYQVELLDSFNDTIPLLTQTSDNSLGFESTTFFQTIKDTLFKNENNFYTFFGNVIPINKLGLSTKKTSLNSLNTQLIGTVDSTKINALWEKVAGLKIIQQYQESNKKNIGFQRIVQNSYDPDWGFTVPKEKFLVYLVK